jgi:hypothetical protein
MVPSHIVWDIPPTSETTIGVVGCNLLCPDVNVKDDVKGSYSSPELAGPRIRLLSALRLSGLTEHCTRPPLRNRKLFMYAFDYFTSL